MSVILGPGTGGAALALLPADSVLCAQHGWLSPLPPEGASVIMHGSVDFAADMAAAQGVSSLDLQRQGIVDRIIPESPDAADDPNAFVARVALAIAESLRDLQAYEPRARRQRRIARMDVR